MIGAIKSNGPTLLANWGRSPYVGRMSHSETDQRQALVRRVQRRISCDGKIVFAAIPSMLEDYVARCEHVFSAMGRELDGAQRDRLRQVLSNQLTEAFSQSHRSTITVSYRAEIAQPLSYSITTQIAKLTDAYEVWVKTRQPPYFGLHADAKVVAVAQSSGNAAQCPALDIGAGTGRNALTLARQGHPVDAVELTPGFANILRDTATKEMLPVRVICEDVFRSNTELRADYGLIVVSEVVSDFRSIAEWRALLELSARCLRVGGKLLVNAFVTQDHYFTDPAAREFGQQAYSFFMTPAEIQSAIGTLPLKLISSDRVYDFEKSHLPADAWPPTPWYEEWVSGQDIFDLPREASPVTLMWLVLEKT